MANIGAIEILNSVDSLVSTSSHLPFTYPLSEETMRSSIPTRYCFSSASTPLVYSHGKHRSHRNTELRFAGESACATSGKSSACEGGAGFSLPTPARGRILLQLFRA